jgi:GT2 family glycosyltransferase
LLEACLRSLVEQCTAAGAELIVARPLQPGDAEMLRERFPGVRLVAAEPGSDIPRLRGLGLQSASGEAALLTEDHCVADRRWVEVLRTAIADADVAGGGMGNAKIERAIDWAAYFAEYGFYAGTRRGGAGPTTLLGGANVAYGPRCVRDVATWALAGEWENLSHDRVRARGGTMRFVPDAKIYQNRSYRFADFCADRYEHGGDYARGRMAQRPDMSRAVRLLACAVLPAVLLARAARDAASVNPVAFIRALPFTLCFLSAWSMGEAVEYWRGPNHGDVRA